MSPFYEGPPRDDTPPPPPAPPPRAIPCKVATIDGSHLHNRILREQQQTNKLLAAILKELQNDSHA